MKVKIEFHNGYILRGSVDNNQLVEFSNGLSSTLYVKTIDGKDTMIHKDQGIFTIEEVK